MASPPPRPLLCPTDVNGNGIPEPPSQPLSTMSSSPSPKPQTASPNTTDNTNTSTPALPLPPISTLLNPAVPPTPGSMIMDCTSDPSRFHPIAIHTAKCAICDKRNMDKMLRCPGCTYQVCAPCCDSRAGAPLVHGNSNPDALIAGLNMTPVRRRVMNRADNGVPATGGTELGMAKAKGKATAKGKGHKKRKSKGKFEEGSEDSDAEETQSVVSNVSASSVEVMPVSKRRKTVSDASKGKSPLGMTVENSSGGVLRRRIDTSMLGREVGENTIQALLEKEGVDTPALRYHEHLLSRSQPVGVNSPPRFTAVNRHQKSVSEDDGSRNGQGVAREKTTETGIEPNMNEMNLHGTHTVREYLNKCIDLSTRNLNLDADQQSVLRGWMTEAGLGFVNRLNSQVSGVGHNAGQISGMDTNLALFNQEQRLELEGVIHGQLRRLKSHFGLTDWNEAPNTPEKRDREAALAIASMSRSSPAVGFFQTTPTRAGRNAERAERPQD